MKLVLALLALLALFAAPAASALDVDDDPLLVLLAGPGTSLRSNPEVNS